MIYSNSCVYLRDVAKSLRASATSPGGFAVRSPFRDFVHLKVLRNAKHFAKPPGVSCDYMKTVILTYILLLIGNFSYSQQTDFWTIFWDEKEETFGFKDNKRQSVIDPKFSSYSNVRRLEHIFIASEEKEEKLDINYLNKSGKEFGRDSIYSFDNTPDCESEGFIRFRDQKTDKVGM